MSSRPRSLAGWLLLAQGAVLAVLAFWARLLIRWPPDEDDPGAWPWDGADAAEQAGAASAVLVVLAVVSVVVGGARLTGRTEAAGTFVAVHVAAGLAVALFGSPLLGVVLGVAGLCWHGLLGRDTRLAGAPGRTPADALR